MRALKPGEKPLRPMYSNIDAYLENPISTFPEPIKGYNPVMGKKFEDDESVESGDQILSHTIHPDKAKYQLEQDIKDVEPDPKDLYPSDQHDYDILGSDEEYQNEVKT